MYDLLERQSPERDKDEVSYFYIRDVFCLHLGTKYADFQEKNLRGDFWENVPNFGYYIKNHFYVIPKVWNFFPEISAKIFFLKIGILSPKVYTKNVPNIEVCNFILAPLRTQSIKQVSE